MANKITSSSRGYLERQKVIMNAATEQHGQEQEDQVGGEPSNDQPASAPEQQQEEQMDRTQDDSSVYDVDQPSDAREQRFKEIGPELWADMNSSVETLTAEIGFLRKTVKEAGDEAAKAKEQATCLADEVAMLNSQNQADGERLTRQNEENRAAYDKKYQALVSELNTRRDEEQKVMIHDLQLRWVEERRKMYKACLDAVQEQTRREYDSVLGASHNIMAAAEKRYNEKLDEMDASVQECNQARSNMINDVNTKFASGLKKQVSDILREDGTMVKLQIDLQRGRALLEKVNLANTSVAAQSEAMKKDLADVEAVAGRLNAHNLDEYRTRIEDLERRTERSLTQLRRNDFQINNRVLVLQGLPPLGEEFFR